MTGTGSTRNGGNRPIRVVRIIDRLNVGGPAKHVVWLTRELDALQFETTLITGTVPETEGDMTYFAHSAGLAPIVVREMSRELGPRDLIALARLLGLLWRLKPQIVHTHKSKAGAAGRIAAQLYKWLTPSALWLRPRDCRIVHTYHGHVFHGYFGKLKTRALLAVENALAFFTDRIIVISEQQRLEICERFGVGRPEQFRVVPLGIDLEECQNPTGDFRREFGIDDRDVLVGAVGRLCEVKNYSMLLDAIARLVREDTTGGRWRLVLVGDGHLRAQLEERARRLGIGDRVIFTGFREDVASLYAAFDIVALTSINEGTPLTLIEAMNAGRVVAATEVGGVVDILGNRRSSPDGFAIWDHGVSGPSGDVAAFAAALRFLLENRARRLEMGSRGRDFVRARLSKERLVSDIELLYRELVGASAAACPIPDTIPQSQKS